MKNEENIIPNFLSDIELEFFIAIIILYLVKFIISINREFL